MSFILTYIRSVVQGIPYLKGIEPYTDAVSNQADIEIGKAQYARRESMLEEAEMSASIDKIARNSGFARLIGETDSALKKLLRSRFDIYRLAGTTEGLIWALERMGLIHIKVISQVDLRLHGVPNPFGGNSSYFFVEIETVDWPPPILWDTTGVYDTTNTWDFQLPYPDALKDIINTIWKWKPAGRRCCFIRLKVLGLFYIIPVGERWEYDSSGNPPSYYTSGY